MKTADDSVKAELQFRLSLLRLMTEPHAKGGERLDSAESRQLEELAVRAPSRGSAKNRRRVS